MRLERPLRIECRQWLLQQPALWVDSYRPEAHVIGLVGENEHLRLINISAACADRKKYRDLRFHRCDKRVSPGKPNAPLFLSQANPCLRASQRLARRNGPSMAWILRLAPSVPPRFDACLFCERVRSGTASPQLLPAVRDRRIPQFPCHPGKPLRRYDRIGRRGLANISLSAYRF
jgi:hypothetical protein